ncbi:5820_t:CDS:2 [Funneliformis caledonium]|uniref:5820_t:CDS:1 n=1 Tax=Funneliformis caledonium TaxID=1117310 RepID=A0A9N9BFX8_9GLOM|nr:5820_t:CDS:2 [Funneliformis caledonium]
MPHFVIQVEEERKVLISFRIVKDTSLSLEKQTLTFNDFFKNLIQPVFRFREVHVFVGKGDSKWNFVQDDLQNELSLLITLGFTHINGVPARDPSVNLEVYTINTDSNDIIKEIYEKFLPDPTSSTENNDHYADFHTVYHKITTEDHCLTLKQIVKSAERTPKRIFVNTKVCDYIECFQCNKLRCIYSNQALDANEKKELYLVKEEINYSCSSSLVDENHEFYTKVYVHKNITCKTPIELAYYSSNSRQSNHNSQICYWCRVDGGLVDPSVEKTSNYKFVFPCCC